MSYLLTIDGTAWIPVSGAHVMIEPETKRQVMNSDLGSYLRLVKTGLWGVVVESHSGGVRESWLIYVGNEYECRVLAERLVNLINEGKEKISFNQDFPLYRSQERTENGSLFKYRTGALTEWPSEKIYEDADKVRGIEEQ